MGGATVRKGMTPGRTDLKLDPTLDFMQSLWALDHGLQRMSKRMRRRFGITGPQRFVLRLIGRFPGIGAGNLAQTLHVHPSTLTGVFQRLEAKRLIVRVKDPSDGRRVVFHLTLNGRRLNSVRKGTVEHALGRAYRRLPPVRLRAARWVLDELAAELILEP